jgi:hypothetical protein
MVGDVQRQDVSREPEHDAEDQQSHRTPSTQVADVVLRSVVRDECLTLSQRCRPKLPNDLLGLVPEPPTQLGDDRGSLLYRVAVLVRYPLGVGQIVPQLARIPEALANVLNDARRTQQLKHEGHHVQNKHRNLHRGDLGGQVARVPAELAKRVPHGLVTLPAGRAALRVLPLNANQVCAESVFVVCGATAVRHAALAYPSVPVVGLQVLARAYPPLPLSEAMCKEPGVHRRLVVAVSASRHRCSNPDVAEIADSPPAS